MGKDGGKVVKTNKERKRYSVHAALDPKHIAVVMDHHERIGRKFDANEIGHALRDAAIAFLASYTGTFKYLVDMKAKQEVYGRLFASQYAAVCNCLVAEITHELQHAVRDEKQHERRAMINGRIAARKGGKA